MLLWCFDSREVGCFGWWDAGFSGDGVLQNQGTMAEFGTILSDLLLERCIPTRLSNAADIWLQDPDDDSTDLRMIPALALVCCEWRSSMLDRQEYHAMRLACRDMATMRRGRRAAKGSRRRLREVLLMRKMYEENLELFSHSWLLYDPIPERLRTAPLQDLSVEELAELRTVLTAGWGGTELTPFEVAAHEDITKIWVSPLFRG